jgi:Tfp pilus assembly protein PilO
VNVKNREKLLLILALGGMALLVGDHLVLTPLKKTWDERELKISDLTKSTTHGAQVQDDEFRIRQRWEGMRTNTLPANNTVAEQKVIQAFDQWARTSRIALNSIKPQWKQNNEDYATLECRVDAVGSLSMLTRFLYDVEHDPLALRVESVEITARDDDGSQLTLGLLVSGLQLIAKETK